MPIDAFLLLGFYLKGKELWDSIIFFFRKDGWLYFLLKEVIKKAPKLFSFSICWIQTLFSKETLSYFQITLFSQDPFFKKRGNLETLCFLSPSFCSVKMLDLHGLTCLLTTKNGLILPWKSNKSIKISLQCLCPQRLYKKIQYTIWIKLDIYNIRLCFPQRLKHTNVWSPKKWEIVSSLRL